MKQQLEFISRAAVPSEPLHVPECRHNYSSALAQALRCVITQQTKLHLLSAPQNKLKQKLSWTGNWAVEHQWNCLVTMSLRAPKPAAETVNSSLSYRQRGEGHAHASKSVQRQCKEDQDGQICRRKSTLLKQDGRAINILHVPQRSCQTADGIGQ